LALTSGTRLGAFEIVSTLGVGGMGEVYRATDTNLKRQVAIKVLPQMMAADPDRLARFQREAEVLAVLNHPNIAHIHGLEKSDGTVALVMELVEGATLADRIAQGAIPLAEALPIAKQLAEALEAAHEQGIVHRDLKPANVKVRDDGTVKVLDFGLAKALEPADLSPEASQSPTITTPAMTQAGVILGTAAYMSPEQAKGRAADKRSDVWAFGCVLYEMLTGRRAFEGEDVGDTLAAVLRGEPDWSVLPADVPPSIRTLLAACLAKDRRRRIGDMSAALFVIDHQAALAPALDALQHVAAPQKPLWRTAIPVAAAILVGLAAGYSGWRLKPAPPRAVTRFAIVPADGFTGDVALSPDGTRFAYSANNRLYLGAFNQLEPTPIAGGESIGLAAVRSPFFSPDGQSLGFWEASQIKKISVSGGAPVPVCTVGPPPFGITWATDNTILVGGGSRGILRVSANGGMPERIFTVNPGQYAAGPQLMPDGRTVLFTVASASGDEAQIVVQSLDRGTRRTVIAGGTNGRYLPTGHVVYLLRGTLLAVPFDPASLSIKAGPVPVVDGVLQAGGFVSLATQFAVSFDGTLAYVPAEGFAAARQTLVWVDRQGREETIAAPPHSYDHPRLAPDGTRLALTISDDNGKPDIWVWDLARGGLSRVTADPISAQHAVWTPDGHRLIFNRDNYLFWQAANGAGTAERLSERFNGSHLVPQTVSPDGKRVVFRGTDGRGGNSDLMILDVGGGRGFRPSEPKPLVATPFEEYNAEISLDGRWLAYQSNRSGVFEVYVRPFPEVESGQWPVSTGGGTEPLWGRDGRELFYRAPTGAVMRVEVAPGTTWKAGSPAQVIEARSYVLGSGPLGRTYDISADGRRFVMMKNAESPAQTSAVRRIVVVQNWTEELKARVPAK
jgi:serine/threonine-protein kinase